MKLPAFGRRGKDSGRAAVLVWQASSLLLAYPDAAQRQRLDLLAAACAEMPADAAAALRPVVAHLRGTPLIEAQQHYVETFDIRSRRALHLTYWTAGDTRNRGTALLRFAEIYRQAGAEPPADELPDHLAVVLEFAASVDAGRGRELLVAHRTSLTTLTSALHRTGTVYAGVLDAVCATIPEPRQSERAAASELAATGPPVESVGLEPFPAMPRGGEVR